MNKFNKTFFFNYYQIHIGMLREKSITAILHKKVDPIISNFDAIKRIKFNLYFLRRIFTFIKQRYYM